MGKKYTLKRSIVKKRPKKRGKYKKKPHDPKKPKTQAEKDEVYPGYEDMNRLAKGIVESDEDEDTEEASLMESFIPPENWGRLMSDRKQTQLLFEERLKTQRARFGNGRSEEQVADDVWDSMKSDESSLEDELSTRLQKVQDRSPEFVRLLTYLVEPILNRPELGVVDDDLSERKKKHRAEQSFDKMNAEQIQAMCRQRFGLMTLDALLNLIDRLNQASAGKLHTQNKQQ